MNYERKMRCPASMLKRLKVLSEEGGKVYRNSKNDRTGKDVDTSQLESIDKYYLHIPIIDLIDE